MPIIFRNSGSTLVITKLEEGRRIAFTGLYQTDEITVREAENGCRVTWSTTLQSLEATETAAAPEELQRVSVVTDLRVPYLLYQIQSVSHPFMLHREKKDFLLTLREYAADGGVMLQTKDELGYLCFLPKEREVEVVECLAAYPEQYRLLLRAAAVYSPSQSATALLPADCGVPGKVVRPIHALGLKPSVRLDQIPELRRAFLVEQY